MDRVGRIIRMMMMMMTVAAVMTSTTIVCEVSIHLSIARTSQRRSYERLQLSDREVLSISDAEDVAAGDAQMAFEY